MLHIVTVIGARPQIIKAAALSRVIREEFAGRIRETIVHTGQHYDDTMSQVFFDELGIPAPDHHLGIGSGTHGAQTAAMIAALETVLLNEKPGAVVLYGDTNSTLAGAIAASKLHIPVVHVEAGLRSYNKSMPEEINRVLCDHVSTLLFSPTKAGYDNLMREGMAPVNRIVSVSADHPVAYHCGDVMYDNSVHFASFASTKSPILTEQQLSEGNYFLATLHRDGNTDVPARLEAIFDGLLAIAKMHALPVILPLHPRTRKQLAASPALEKKLNESKLVRLLPPVSFLDMLLLEKNAKLVLTDSGGVQKEAFFFEKPCVILRPETEWVELVECGSAILADADASKIEAAVQTLLQKTNEYPRLFGDGRAAAFICGEMLRHFS